MPKTRKTPASPKQTAAAARARAVREIPPGMIAVQSTVWLPAEMVDAWKGQKPGDRGEAWTMGMGGDFPWDELETLRERDREIRKLLEIRK